MKNFKRSLGSNNKRRRLGIVAYTFNLSTQEALYGVNSNLQDSQNFLVRPSLKTKNKEEEEKGEHWFQSPARLVSQKHSEKGLSLWLDGAVLL